MFDRHFGFLSARPAELGTGLTVKVEANLGNLVKRPAELAGLGAALGMRTKVTGAGTVEVSNAKTMGLTEAEIVARVVAAVRSLVDVDEPVGGGFETVSAVDEEEDFRADDGAEDSVDEVASLGDDGEEGDAASSVEAAPDELGDDEAAGEDDEDEWVPEVGDGVEAYWAVDKMWVGASIIAVNDDGTWQVGDEEGDWKCSADEIRELEDEDEGSAGEGEVEE